MGPNSFQWCPVTGQGAMGTKRSIGSSIWTRGRTSSLWGWRSTGTGCPGRQWSLLLWRYSRPSWTRSCAACCRWPCLSRRVGLDDPQRSLPTPTILWFCDSVNYECLYINPVQVSVKCLSETLYEWQFVLWDFFYNLLWIRFMLVVVDHKRSSMQIFDISLNSGNSETSDTLLLTWCLENRFPVGPGAQQHRSSDLVALLWKSETSNSGGLGTLSPSWVSMENYPLNFSWILTHLKKWAVFSVWLVVLHNN